MKPVPIHTLELRTVLTYALLLIVGLSFLAYAMFQARFLLQGPQVTFSQTPPTTQTNRTVEISGVAENIVLLTLNDREIYTDKNGYFKEVIVLENGYTVATLAAKDRYGREREYEHAFIYTPAVSNL